MKLTRRRRRWPVLALAIAALTLTTIVWPAQPATAATNANLQVVNDCYLVSDNYSSQNNCQSGRLEVGLGPGGTPEGTCGLGTPKWCKRRSLLKLNVSGVPAGSQVTGATLKLRLIENRANVRFGVDLFENSKGFDNAATWQRYNATCAQPCWAGGSAGEDQGATVVPAQSGATVQFSLRPRLVESWLNGGAGANHGVLLRATVENRAEVGSIPHLALFHSSTATDPALRPVLALTYTMPTAGATPASRVAENCGRTAIIAVPSLPTSFQLPSNCDVSQIALQHESIGARIPPRGKHVVADAIDRDRRSLGLRVNVTSSRAAHR